MDEADRGNDQAEKTLDAYIRQVRQRAATGLVPMGECYNCGETLRNQLFCCTECREDFDYRDRVHRKTGI